MTASETTEENACGELSFSPFIPTRLRTPIKRERRENNKKSGLGEEHTFSRIMKIFDKFAFLWLLSSWGRRHMLAFGMGLAGRVPFAFRRCCF